MRHIDSQKSTVQERVQQKAFTILHRELNLFFTFPGEERLSDLSQSVKKNKFKKTHFIFLSIIIIILGMTVVALKEYRT